MTAELIYFYLRQCTNASYGKMQGNFTNLTLYEDASSQQLGIQLQNSQVKADSSEIRELNQEDSDSVSLVS